MYSGTSRVACHHWTNRGSPAVVAEAAAKERESESSRSSRTSCPSIGKESWRTKEKENSSPKKKKRNAHAAIVFRFPLYGGHRPKNLLSVMGKCLELFCTDGRFHEIARGGGHLAFVWGRVIPHWNESKTNRECCDYCWRRPVYRVIHDTQTARLRKSQKERRRRRRRRHWYWKRKSLSLCVLLAI